MGQTEYRTPEAIFNDHLQKALDGAVEADLARNYSEDVLFLTGWGIFRGHDGGRHLFRRLSVELPNWEFVYHTRLVEGEVAFLEWTATADGAVVRDGVDSFVIRNGQIVVQTIHYSVEKRPESTVS